MSPSQLSLSHHISHLSLPPSLPPASHHTSPDLVGAPPPHHPHPTELGTGHVVGLGYGIAIAVGILVLISTIMLASYVCVRVKGGSAPRHQIDRPPRPTAHDPLTAGVPPGLDAPTIDSYPKFVYGSTLMMVAVEGLCPICLSEYEAGEVVRVVPECEHCFHAGSVDEWLRVSATCPLCRRCPVPSAASTPVATPLSELIPLAMHAR